MYKVIKKSECPVHKIDEMQTAFNYITKEISPDVSLIVVANTESNKEYLAEYNRIYYVLSGVMKLSMNSEQLVLETGDACFIEKGTSYKASGTYMVVVINQPAYGTK